MQHNWFHNSDTDNLKTNISLLQNALVSSSSDKTKLTTIFSHVPKAAGTSLEAILNKNYLMSDSLHINAPDLNKCPDLLSIKKKSPKLICGHHPLHGILYQLLDQQPIYHLTMLRDPASRVISYYNYVKGKTDHPMHRYAVTDSLIDFINNCPSPEMSNGMCKRFSGRLHTQQQTPDDELFDAAKENLKKCFNLVLTSCLFDESMLLLKQQLNLKDIYYKTHNVSNKFIAAKQLTEQQAHVLESSNQADLRLYQWAKTRLENQLSDQVKAADIETFRTNNQSWTDLIKG
ncbi:sulfotransferase family 2 domain-containing protein [Marinicella sp. S1101]|uniref:sulfotransferase family 2 domain-containing protein n=1 Tax=Marinicella marina TaxID=2996016 RepID=UPI002260F6DC|nr:sulfotransferase family 2 domain-containing protein [Marinicella marina]MCX7552934.1 sulfotransferase family 2 domain-containing protein [Marinicella marina]MDJ1139757.1 sulfotransferase family 2 domain-containing protein [Marinicella marina]